MSNKLDKLEKGDRISLFEARPEMIRLLVGVGWRARPGIHPDVDVAAFLLGAGGSVLSDQHFVYYNNPVSPDGSVRLLGDARPETTRADDEAVAIDLLRVPPQVMNIRIAISIYAAVEQGLTFEDLRDTYLRLLDADSGTEVARYELDDRPAKTAVVVADLYRFAGRWKFHALNQGHKDGLHGIAAQLGVNV